MRPAAQRRVAVLARYLAACFFATLAALEAAAAQPTARTLRFEPWQPVLAGGRPLILSYCSLLPRRSDDIVEMWFDAQVGKHDAVIGLRGTSLGALDRTLPRFDSTIIRGYTADLLGRATPIISRSSCTRLRDGRHVVVASIGPAYGAGGRSTELYPALFTSPDGSAASWTHIGPPAGEPKADLDRRAAAKQLIRSDGGTLVERSDGRLHLYLHWDDAAGLRLVRAEATRVEGPWTFLRDASGKIRNLAPTSAGGTWIFPSLCVLPGERLLLTGGNAWPPTELWVAASSDGVAFTVLDGAPQLTAAQIRPGTSATVKSLRLAYDATRHRLDAVANPADGSGGYQLWWSTATFAPGFLPAPASATAAASATRAR